jgi:hypothetical protein
MVASKNPSPRALRVNDEDRRLLLGRLRQFRPIGGLPEISDQFLGNAPSLYAKSRRRLTVANEEKYKFLKQSHLLIQKLAFR